MDGANTRESGYKVPADSSRLKRRAEFLAVAAVRRSSAQPGIVVQMLRGEDRINRIRVGFTASRKVGNAVLRNRARRRLRELARRILPSETVVSADFVLIARRETVDRPFCDLETDLRAALRRLGVWCQPLVSRAPVEVV